MFFWRVFIIVISCSTLCWSLKLDFNQNYHRRESRQANTTNGVENEKTCPPLISLSVDITCSRNGLKVDCTKPVMHGTIADTVCKAFYYISGAQFSSPSDQSNHLECKNGLWDHNLLECNPVCGLKHSNKRVRRIVGGNEIEIREYPWHVGIYKKITISNSTKFSQICGGSIISPKMVITAAHCFEGGNPTDYSVAAGKSYRKWDDKRDLTAQFRNISELHIPEKYKGLRHNYANDIAILIMDEPLVIDLFVSPICVDWTTKTEKKLLVNGSIGYVTGWGYNEPFGDSSDKLKHLPLPYVPYETCYDKSDADFLPIVGLPDKFCAGRTDGQNVCTGDAGGGLSFELTDTYYLMGITSIGPNKEGGCDVSKYATFTTFSYHAKWAETIWRINS